MKTLAFMFFFLSLGSLSWTPRASAFDHLFKRYLSDQDLLRVLQQKFPNPGNSVIETACKSFSGTDAEALSRRNALGASNPGTGEPAMSGPNPGFMRWYSHCLKQYIDADTAHMETDATKRRYFGKIIPYDADSLMWNTWTSYQQKEAVIYLIHRFIGPGIVADEAALARKLMQNANKMNQASVKAALAQIAYLICMRDDFLTY